MRALRRSAPLWRVPAFYFIHFFGVGVILPFLNLYFQAVGMSGAQLGFLNAVPRLANAVAPPIFGALADKFRCGREMLLSFALISAAVALAIGTTGAFWLLLALVVVFTALRSPLIPVAENVCLRDVREQGGQYGRRRWWGSLGFILAAAAAGRLIDRISLAAMFPLLAASVLAVGAVVAFFPREGGPPRPDFRRDLAALLRRRPLLVFLSASLLVSLSSGPYGVYFSIYMKGLGMSASLIGLAWTVGVLSEIGFLLFAQSIQRRIGLKAMIAAGMFASALRWELTTWTTSGAFLIGIQALHGIAFGVYHAASVLYVDRLSGPATKNTGQALYGASTFGAGATLGALLAGWLHPVAGFENLLHAAAAIALAAAAGFCLLAARESELAAAGPAAGAGSR